MAWSHQQEVRRKEIRAMTFAELIHIMISNHDGTRYDGLYTQNFDYFWASDELDRRWQKLNGGPDEAA